MDLNGAIFSLSLSNCWAWLFHPMEPCPPKILEQMTLTHHWKAVTNPFSVPVFFFCCGLPQQSSLSNQIIQRAEHSFFSFITLFLSFLLLYFKTPLVLWVSHNVSIPCCSVYKRCCSDPLLPLFPLCFPLFLDIDKSLFLTHTHGHTHHPEEIFIIHKPYIESNIIWKSQKSLTY